MDDPLSCHLQLAQSVPEQVQLGNFQLSLLTKIRTVRKITKKAYAKHGQEEEIYFLVSSSGERREFPTKKRKKKDEERMIREMYVKHLTDSTRY